MKAKSFQVGSIGEFDAELEAAIDENFHPSLAIIFSSPLFDPEELTRMCSNRGLKVFGGNSWGDFTDAKIETRCISCMLLDISAQRFSVRLDKLEPGSENSVGKDIASWAKEMFENPALMIITSHLETRAEDLLDAFVEVLGPDANIVGGAAGMLMDSTEHDVFSDEHVSDRAVVSLLLDGDHIQVSGRATCGWKAVGSERTVTKSDGDWVYEIDGKPALDVVLKYVGMNDSDLIDMDTWFHEVNTLPIQLIREKGPPVMRPALVYDEKARAIMCSGRIPEGSRIQFSIEPGFDVIEEVIEACKDLKESEAPEADAVIYISCMGRYLSLGPLLNKEIATVRELWNAPMAGFLSSGEMARVTGGSLEWNAITSCCIVLKEI